MEDDQPVASSSQGKRKTRQLVRNELEKRKRYDEAERRREMLQIPCERDIILDGPRNVVKTEPDNFDQAEQKPNVQPPILVADNSANLESAALVKQEMSEDEDIVIKEEANLSDVEDEQQYTINTVDYRIPEGMVIGSMSHLESYIRHRYGGHPNWNEAKALWVRNGEPMPKVPLDIATGPTNENLVRKLTSQVKDEEKESEDENTNISHLADEASEEIAEQGES